MKRRNPSSHGAEPRVAGRQRLIVAGSELESATRHGLRELQADLRRATGQAWRIVRLPADADSAGLANESAETIIIGTPRDNPLIGEAFARRWLKAAPDVLGEEGYILQSRAIGRQRRLYLAAQGMRGALYALYDFSEHYLGVDPYEFWSGRMPPRLPAFTLPSVRKIKPAPLFPYRIWSDDDSDELANYRGRKLEYDMATWRGIVRTLLRTGYNGIWLCDRLGRGEFYLDTPLFGEYYRRMRPHFQTDLNLLKRMICYAREHGMLVGTTLAFTQFNHLPPNRAHWERNKAGYLKVWKDYLTRYPTRAADFYVMWSLGPYLDGCPFFGDAPPTHIAREQMHLVDGLLAVHKPEARVFYCLCRNVGLDFAQLRFPARFIPCVGTVKKDFPRADPDILAVMQRRKVPAGILTHICLGTHYTHLIHDPIAERIGTEVRKAVRSGATKALILDGQTLRNFLFNLSAMQEAVWRPADYRGRGYYLSWSRRQFGRKAAPGVAWSLRHLHAANEQVFGYTFMVETYLWCCPAGGVIKDRQNAIHAAIVSLEKSHQAALAARPLIAARDRLFFESAIVHQAAIFLTTARLCRDFEELVQKWERLPFLQGDLPEFAQTRRTALVLARRVLHKALAVDRLFRYEPLRKFKRWYLPANQRIYTPPRPPAFYRRFIRALMHARPNDLGKDWELMMAELGIRIQELEKLKLYRQQWMV